MKKIKRKNKNQVVDLLNDVQKLIFAPLAFQAIGTMIELGLFELLDKNALSKNEIMTAININEYTINTLLDVAEINNMVVKKNGKYSLTKIGELFLYNDMVKANFNFVNDVCYLGASKLKESFLSESPEGLKKFIGNYETIYPVLTELPKRMQKSWFEFDHFYSDICFNEVFNIISNKFNSIFDIGGNTGKFERICLKSGKNINITMLDLPENMAFVKNNPDLEKCNFYPIDVLSPNAVFPEIKNSAVIMSQFLDCFSKKDVVKILTNIEKVMDENSSVFILEPYIDMQKYFGAKYSLIHSSLYFTCMANGVSKFYNSNEMMEMVEQAGLKTLNCINNIGKYNYTLLECTKNAVVSC